MTRRCITSCPKARPSARIVFRWLKSHQKPTPITSTKTIRTPKIWPDSRAAECLVDFILVSEPDSFNYFSVPNQCAMFLLAGVCAEAIARVDGEADEITIKVLALFAQVGRLWVAFPFNAGARGVDQLRLQPVGHDFFVVGWIRPVKRGVLSLGFSC